jgi:hypothetical protein
LYLLAGVRNQSCNFQASYWARVRHVKRPRSVWLARSQQNASRCDPAAPEMSTLHFGHKMSGSISGAASVIPNVLAATTPEDPDDLPGPRIQKGMNDLAREAAAGRTERARPVLRLLRVLLMRHRVVPSCRRDMTEEREAVLHLSYKVNTNIGAWGPDLGCSLKARSIRQTL